MRLPACLASILCLLTLASACGGAQDSTALGTTTGAGSNGRTTTTPAGSHPCVPGTHTICITAADRGRTITVSVGATLTVELRAPRRSFSRPTVSGAKVLALIGSSQSAGAAEAHYRALAPGRAVLRSVERPVCARGRACPEFLLLWQVSVLVRSARPPSRAG